MRTCAGKGTRGVNYSVPPRLGTMHAAGTAVVKMPRDSLSPHDTRGRPKVASPPKGKSPKVATPPKVTSPRVAQRPLPVVE